MILPGLRSDNERMIMNKDLSASQERIYVAGDLMSRLNEVPGGPAALAAANVRRERRVRLYERHPRLFPLLARARKW
jgi:hypothetical protein